MFKILEKNIVQDFKVIKLKLMFLCHQNEYKFGIGAKNNAFHLILKC